MTAQKVRTAATWIAALYVGSLFVTAAVALPTLI
jgi:hypothetical protein